MSAITENSITDVALEQMSGTSDPRLREIMECLVRHLRAFACEADLTPEEWLGGIKFLTAVGQACTPYRQEFILLSDTLGLSSLINSLYDRREIGVGTRTSLLGPFYRQGAPHEARIRSSRKPGPTIRTHRSRACPQFISIFGSVLRRRERSRAVSALIHHKLSNVRRWSLTRQSLIC